MFQCLRLVSVAAILTAAAIAQIQKPLTNDDIVQMVKAEFQESLILKAIESNETAFDTSGRGLITLKENGVGEKVIEAMLAAAARKRLSVQLAAAATVNPAPSPTATVSQPKKAPEALASTPHSPTNPAASGQSSAATSSPNGPRSETWPAEVADMPRENGIYYKRDGRFTALFGKPVVRTETAGRVKAIFTGGFSRVRSRAELVGKSAQLQFSERQPEFYVVVPEGQSPEALSLIKLDQEGDRRRFQIASGGGIAGRSDSGYDLDEVRQVVIERIGPRLYTVTPVEELKPGEYGFVGTVTYATVGVASAGVLVYDFGIMKKR